MAQEEILKRLMRKVEKNGYKITLGISNLSQMIEHKIYYKFIFDHAFAKALWGWDVMRKDGKDMVMKDKKIIINGDDLVPVYVFRLQEMVKEDDYLQYLAKYI